MHDSTVRFMLAGPLHVHGEAAEQLGAYQDVITCKPLIAAIASLAWDVDRARLKRGFSGSGPGSAGRVPVVAKQFRLTYDLDSMRPEQILDLLPREFDRFREQLSGPEHNGRRSEPDGPGANRVPKPIRSDDVSSTRSPLREDARCVLSLSGYKALVNNQTGGTAFASHRLTLISPTRERLRTRRDPAFRQFLELAQKN